MSHDDGVPYHPEAEMAVLGAILIDPEVLPLLQELVPPAAFYREAHQRIYQAMLALDRQDRPIDLVAVQAQLGAESEAVGGWPYLVQLSQVTPTAGHAEHYAGLVREAWLRRRLLQAAATIRGLARDPGKSIQEVLAEAEAALLPIGQSGAQAEPALVGAGAIDQLAVWASPRALGGLPTGLPDLDLAWGAVRPGDLVILAARPSMGKSALALQIAYHLAGLRRPVLVVSLEMGLSQLVERLASGVLGLDAQLIRQRRLTEANLERLSGFASRLAVLPLFADSAPRLTTAELRSRARRLRARHGLDLVVVDYLQLLDVPDRRGANRQEQVAEISRSLKALALELQVPVLALSQLSREAERQDDRVPQLWNLRESGAIEQDADLVAFLHRPGGKGPRLSTVIETEVIVAKSRYGPTGSCFLVFRPAQVRFESYSAREER